MSDFNDADTKNTPFQDTVNDLPGVIVGNAFVAAQGAQVLSWRDGDGRERLYLSPLTGGLKSGDDDSDLKAKAIRGGSPISFPQFSGRGALPKHGFIRNMRWHSVPLGSAPAAATGAADGALALACSDSAATRALWPHAFAARVDVQTAADRLHIALTVVNSGDAPCEFTVALHTYLRVGDIRNVRLQGLQGVTYQDATADNILVVQAEPELSVSQETDRVYLSPPKQLTLHELDAAPLLIEQHGFEDSVIWNPGPVNAAALGDFPDDGWLHMLCVEAACVNIPVRLAPGQSWTGSQTLTAVR
ncbi:MAG TPA: D-hexose-6-phosphate mutarotase [Herbaspirillum sp.]|jgi:glucose-6-phosphate 1-epimerase